MADFLPLQQLLSQGRVADWPVAACANQPINFADFRAQVGRWAKAFAGQPGQRWALYFEDSLVFAAALFGAWHAGKCVYLPADKLPTTIARLRGEVDGFAGELPAECLPLQLQDDSTAAPAVFDELELTAVALVVYTSGSSGQPSAIPKQLGQLFNEVANLEVCWPTLPMQALVRATVSHQHIYGLLFRVLWPLAAGRPFAAERLVYPEDILAALQHGNSLLIASPAHLKRLPEQLGWAAARHNLAGVFSSGGPLPAEAIPACLLLLGQAPIEIYGSSETGGIAWRQRADCNDHAWQALPGVQFRHGETGCLQVSSNHLPDADWYTTADLVALNTNGFELLGRADRIVKIEEKRVSLHGMEQTLLASGLLAEVRVLSQPGSRTQLVVVAVPNPAGWALFEQAGKSALSRNLRHCLAKQVETAVLPRRWRYCWALPQNSQGKTTEAALQALFDPRRPETCLLSRSEEQAELRLTVAQSSPYFDGHFPAAPILPGVCQIEWAILFGRELFALPPDFLRMEAIKFQQVITPGSEITLTLTFAAERGSLSFKLHSSAGQHASGRIVFGVKP